VALAEKFFDLQELPVRLPAAILGSLTVILIYLLVKHLWKNKYLGLLAAFFLSICPWHIILSRASSEDIVANFLILLGLLFFLNKKIINYFLALCFFVLSFYFYFSSRIIIPLVILGMGLIYSSNKLLRKKAIFSFLIICFILMIITLLSHQTRFQAVSIFTNIENKLIVEEQIREDGMLKIKPMVARIFHNKALQLAKAFINQYGKYFSLDFLFIEGGLPIRYKIPASGLLLLTTLPLTFLGLVFLLKNIKLPINKYLLWCLLVAPVPAALTYENSPNIRRASFLIFCLVIVQALGTYYLLTEIIKKRRLRVMISSLLLILIIFDLTLFIHNGMVNAKMHRPWERNYGYKDLINYINKIEGDYQAIYVSEAIDNDPYIFFLFYLKANPNDYQKVSYQKPARLAGDNKEQWQWGKYIFVREQCPFVANKNVLIVGRGECQEQKNFKSLKQIYRTDMTPIFNLYVYNDNKENEN